MLQQKSLKQHSVCTSKKTLAQQNSTQHTTVQTQLTRHLVNNMQNSPQKNLSVMKAQDTQRTEAPTQQMLMVCSSMLAKDTTKWKQDMHLHLLASKDNAMHWLMATMSHQKMANICMLKNITSVMQTAHTSFLTPKHTT